MANYFGKCEECDKYYFLSPSEPVANGEVICPHCGYLSLNWDDELLSVEKVIERLKRLPPHAPLVFSLGNDLAITKLHYRVDCDTLPGIVIIQPQGEELYEEGIRKDLVSQRAEKPSMESNVISN